VYTVYLSIDSVPFFALGSNPVVFAAAGINTFIQREGVFYGVALDGGCGIAEPDGTKIED